MASERNGTLYIEMTNDLRRRVSEHCEGTVEGFTKRYAVKMLAYYEATTDATAAIRREKQLKGWNRAWKKRLIQEMNPEWNDLTDSIM